MDTFTIGGFALDTWEMPSEIRIPASHKYTKQSGIGGDRAFDAMGPDPKPMKWTGLARSSNAVGDMMAIRAMCVGGREVTLAFNQWFFQVLIIDFTFTYKRMNECKYEIEVEIVSDPQADSGAAVATSMDALIWGDLSMLQGMIT